MPPAYPADFLWGVSTAAYQTEGGLNGPGEPHNNWASHEQSGRVHRTGHAVAFWQRWPDDLDLARSLGVNAFRLGLEWARLEPTSGDWDLGALDRYADLIAGVFARGMTPVVTLHHFTHPRWLGDDPWLDPATPARFARFTRELAAALTPRLDRRGAPPVPFWVTVNEPNALATATYYLDAFPRGPTPAPRRALSLALAHLVTAHVLARRALLDHYDAHHLVAPVVTFNAWASSSYAAGRYLVDLCRPDTRRRTRDLAVAFREALGPLGWRNRLADRLVSRHIDPAAFAPLVALLGPSEDASPTLGLDYYHPFLGEYLGWLGPRRHPWQWPLDADRMPRFLAAWAAPHKAPLYLLEHGLGTRGERPRKDLARPAALSAALDALDVVVAGGLDLRGYFHWSLIDNYEWGSFTPRFGLFGVDRDTLARLPTDATGAPSADTYRELIAARRAR